MGEAYSAFWSRFADFSGRSSRLEFWVPAIVNWVIAGVLGGLADKGSHWYQAPFGIALWVFGIAVFIPTLAVIVRRVRDTGVKNLVLWAVLAIIFPIVSLFFGIIEKDHYARR